MAKEAVKVTTEPNGKLGNGGGKTGNKTKSTGMPATAGTFKDAYGAGKNAKDKEKTPSGNKTQAPKEAPPMAGEGGDDYGEGAGKPSKGKKPKAKAKVTSIQGLRDLAKAKGY